MEKCFENLKEQFFKVWKWKIWFRICKLTIVLELVIIGCIISKSNNRFFCVPIQMAAETIVDAVNNNSLEYADLAVFHEYPEADTLWGDYRSVVPPMFISVVVTLLGCLITTYIFLKEALDRIADQKSYAVDIVEKYRIQTIRRLQCLFIISMFLTGVTAIVYFAIWEKAGDCRWTMHIIWIANIILIVILSGIFLNQCVKSEENLMEQAICMEPETRGKIKELLGGKEECARELLLLYARDSGQKILCNDEGITQYLIELLDMGEAEGTKLSGGLYNWKSFIYHFSALEEWLLLLADTFLEHKDAAVSEARLLHALNHGEKLNEEVLSKVIKPDLASNKAGSELLKRFESIKRIIDPIRAEELFEIYNRLSKYRNVLRFIYEINEDRMKSVSYEEIDPVLKVYLILQTDCYLTYLKAIPRVQVTQPMERLQDINLYNCRIEDSSFRGASFYYALLSRVKAVNTNFDMVLFKHVSFLNADIRNCALSNCIFENTELEAASFVNTDFNNSRFEKCSFKSAAFHDTRFSNNILVKVNLRGTEFTGSRMWDIELKCPDHNEIVSCVFDDTDIKQWVIKPGEKEEYQRKLQKLTNVNKGEEENQRWFFYGIAKIYRELDHKWEHFQGKRLNQNELKELCEKTNDCLKGYFDFDWKKKYVPGREVWKELSKLCRIKFENSTFLKAKIQESCFYQISFQQGLFRQAQMEKAQWLFLDMRGCMLNEANLKESCLIGVNLHQSNMEKVLLYKAHLSMVNMADSNLIRLQASKSEMFGCYFNRSDCSSADLTNAKIQYSSFDDGIINQAELTRSRFENVNMKMIVGRDWLSSYSEFIGCHFEGAVLKGANFNYTAFTNCTFDFATLEGIAATGTVFRKCSFKQSNFRESCMIDTEFNDCEEMQSEYFEGAKLINCKFFGESRGLEQLLKEDKKVVVMNDD